jgi:hypothetical protein
MPLLGYWAMAKLSPPAVNAALTEFISQRETNFPPIELHLSLRLVCQEFIEILQ